MNLKSHLITLGVTAAFTLPASAATDVAPELLSATDISDASGVTVSLTEKSDRRKVKAAEAEPVTFHASLTESGTLASVLGDNIYDIDAIVVEGPMNDTDFNTLWDSSFNGYLKVIDLEKAVIESGKVPDHAMFHIDEQVDWGTMMISTVWLEKIVLPDNVTEIGDFAFAYATTLTEVNFPSALSYIGKSAFTDCVRLPSARLKFNEGLEGINGQAFYHCYALAGEIELPSSLKWIGGATFYQCPITDINFPDGLEYIGDMAFAGSRITKAILPDDCYLSPYGGQFYNDMALTEAHLPDNLQFVPEDIFSGCIKLTKVNIPSRAVTIGEFAFDATDIDKIEFPSTLETIGEDAFQGCGKLTEILLPASMKSLGNRAFACRNLQKIYCMAAVPPTGIPGFEGDNNPFGEVKTSIPVYIPVGTTPLYQVATGWSQFSNFIETDDFPSAGIADTIIDCPATDSPTYDLNGRKVQTTTPGKIYIRNGQKFLSK